MGDIPGSSYDEMAPYFHLIFESWEASMERQAAAADGILRRECGGAGDLRVLDCACGIGTQLLGLARRGYSMTGSDLSASAVERARLEVAARGLEAQLFVADMRDLSAVPGDGFDGVIAMDNSLPHLTSERDLLRAAREIRAKLRPGGVFLASIRDYDTLMIERPVVQGPSFFTDGGARRIIHQVWDWSDERRYTFHLYVTRQTPGGWDTRHSTGDYRAVKREELSDILRAARFESARWVFPAESGFYQPVVVARNAQI